MSALYDWPSAISIDFSEKLGLKPRPSGATFWFIFFQGLCYHAPYFKGHSIKARFK